jgi:glycosyltransferase involved in cell wall biosynthesis
LREAISCFLEQDYKDKELIVLNNHPVRLAQPNLPQVRIINKSGFPTLGDCRNFLLNMAKGEFVRTWDDDDLYLPWAISQGVEGILTGEACDAFKPQLSWWSRANLQYEIGGNQYEASWTLWTDVAKRHGYKASGGDEHSPLFNIQIREEVVRPSYVYRWDTPLHRISGLLGSVTIEEQHRIYMEANQDHGDGIPITPVDLSVYWEAIGRAEDELEDSIAIWRDVRQLSGVI